MKNRERPEVMDAMLKSIKDVSLLEPHLYVLEEFCKNIGVELHSKKQIEEWMNSEYVEPYKLTKVEKCVLECIPKDYKWIARDESSWIFCYKEKPMLGSNGRTFVGEYCQDLTIFKNIFKSITFENSPLNIHDVLKNCEVVE